MASLNNLGQTGFKGCINECIQVPSLTDFLSRNTNVTHTVVLRPRSAGYFNMSWASVNYQSPEKKQIVSVLSTYMHTRPSLIVLGAFVYRLGLAVHQALYRLCHTTSSHGHTRLTS